MIKYNKWLSYALATAVVVIVPGGLLALIIYRIRIYRRYKCHKASHDIWRIRGGTSRDEVQNYFV